MATCTVIFAIGLLLSARAAWHAAGAQQQPEDESTLKCYQCGTGNEASVTCHDFEHTLRWAPFEVLCPPRTLCSKTIKNGTTTTRACASSQDTTGRRSRLECIDLNEQSTICFCDSKLCNPAATQRASTTTQLLLALALAGCSVFHLHY